MMEDVSVKFAENNDLVKIAKLSKVFEKENCCNGIIADTEDFFKDKKIVVAKLKNDIIGYCYGEVEIKKRDTSFFKAGQKSFYIEEMYVDKKYRNKNVGQKLFEFIENFAKGLGCEILETTAVSKDYKRLLKFYIEKMNMEFWSANVIKKI